MKFDIETFIATGLSPTSFMLLYFILNDDKELYDHLVTKNDIRKSDFIDLETNGYIKITDDGWILRKKSLDLQAQIDIEPQFEEFWSEYHKVTGLPKTDLQPALKYWKKLTKTEKKLALEKIKPYFYSLPVYSTGRPIKKARTYLADANYNDEFSYKEEKSSINKMI